LNINADYFSLEKLALFADHQITFAKKHRKGKTEVAEQEIGIY